MHPVKNSLDIRLIATDLDGTILGRENGLFLYTSFQNKINEFKKRNNAMWVICTGRSLKSFRKVFEPLRMIGLFPDFIIVDHSYIYSPVKLGYTPHLLWSLKISCIVFANKLLLKTIISKWLKTIKITSPEFRVLLKNKNRLCLLFDSEESAKSAIILLKNNININRLQIIRHVNEVDIIAIPYTKGMAISQLSQHLSILPGNILTIGNGINDLSMFNRNIAKFTGCPLNSDPKIIEAIHNMGGHIASVQSLSGTIEILDAHLTDTICNALPDNWQYSSLQKRQKPISHKHHKKDGNIWNYLKKIFIFIAIIYVTLLTFASLGLIPFSGIIMKPYTFFLSKICNIITRI